MKILLVCNAGMSTSILVREMEKAAKEQQLELEVTAMGFTQAEKFLLGRILLCGAKQERHQLTGLQKAAEGKVPVEVMNMRDYGMMNGANVLKRALEIINE